MTDNHSPEVRAYNMSKIRSKDTKPEDIVRKYLFSLGFRYRKNDKCYPGHPDIVLPKYHTVIFVNGCFWHHHNCKYFVWPKSNEEFWKNKINRNVERDIEAKQKLEELGFTVFTIWECELKKSVRESNLQDLVSKIKSQQETEMNSSQFTQRSSD